MIELAGAALVGVDSVPELSGPTLINRDPAPTEANVPRATPIALEVTVANDDALDAWSARVWINGVLAFDASAAAPISAAFAGPSSAATTSAHSVRLVLAPLVALSSAATMSVRVVASSAKGTLRIDEMYAFLVEDVSPPALVAALSTGARGVDLAFDKDVLLTAAAAFTLAPTSAPAVPGTVAQAVPSGSVVSLSLAAPLSPGVVYTATAVGVADTHGHVLAAPGSSFTFTAFAPPQPPDRKFDLWSMVPKMNRRADTSGDLAAFVACIQEVATWLYADIDALFDLLDIERAPEWMLDRILEELGNPFTFDLTELEKRRLAAILVEIYQLVGTAPGIQAAVRFFVGLDDIQITPLTATTMVLGESELGVDWELGPGERFDRYAFEVTVPRALTDAEQTAVSAIVNFSKPAHTHFIGIQAPSLPPTPGTWEIGTSQLGVDTVLA